MEEKGEMTFLQHLEELRWHIIKAVLAVVVFSIVAFICKTILFDKVLMAPSSASFWTNRMLCELGHRVNAPGLCINTKPLELQNIQVSGMFMAHIKISMIAGLVLAFPFIFYEFWKFVRPALYQNEKRHTTGAIFYISFLFLLGVVFGYFLITPLSINFLYNYKISDVVKNVPTLGSYVSLITTIVLASGILFELPVLVFFLSKIGLVTAAFLKKYRKHAVIVILLVAGIITPPDIFSQIMVSLPLLLLYEVSIVIARRVEKKRELIDNLVG
jgi:sec-independent protein translocase protein TatC